MSLKEHHRKLERLYHNAPTNVYYEPRLSVLEGRAQIRMPIKPDFFHAAAAVH
ncbi:MAG: thioesterase, partial [Gammaproteobacteria bacterium]|nr:thioesterase [Gammaproteobacteria bacterium]NIR82128.1 thioesterase [Gammaproteobacteria bacterium]NIV75082.1 thioesterase [Gammaproteobacteria bacterium]